MAASALAAVLGGLPLGLACLLREALLRLDGDGGSPPVGQVPAVEVEREHVRGRAYTCAPVTPPVLGCGKG